MSRKDQCPNQDLHTNGMWYGVGGTICTYGATTLCKGFQEESRLDVWVDRRQSVVIDVRKLVAER